MRSRRRPGGFDHRQAIRAVIAKPCTALDSRVRSGQQFDGRLRFWVSHPTRADLETRLCWPPISPRRVVGRHLDHEPAHRSGRARRPRSDTRLPQGIPDSVSVRFRRFRATSRCCGRTATPTQIPNQESAGPTCTWARNDDRPTVVNQASAAVAAAIVAAAMAPQTLRKR